MMKNFRHKPLTDEEKKKAKKEMLEAMLAELAKDEDE